MPIKVIKQGGDIPNNQVGIYTNPSYVNPRAENSLSELSFEGHSRTLNSTIYTNKLNDPTTGKLFFKTYPVNAFTSPLSDQGQGYHKVSTFSDVVYRDDFIFVGAMEYTSPNATYNRFSGYSADGHEIGRVYIYKADGTHWATIPSPAPSERSYFRFGISLDYDPSVGKIYVGAIDPGSFNNQQLTGGLLYIYDWDGSQKFTTSDWGTPTVVQASDRIANQRDYFGHIVRAKGGYVAVVAKDGGPNGYGKVYTYDSNGSNEVAIVPSDSYYSGTTDVQFGCSLDIDGNSTDGYKIVVGSDNWEDTGGSNRQGGAFVYNVDGTGEVMILPSLPSARRCYNFGFNVAIDVSAGKVIIACPDTTDTNIGYTAGRDVGMISVHNLDGTGQVNIDPIYPPTPNPLPYSSWPSQTEFGFKIGICRSTERLFVYQDRTGPDGQRRAVQIMDYDGSNAVTNILYNPPASALYPDPTGQWPFGKEMDLIAKDGQAHPHSGNVAGYSGNFVLSMMDEAPYVNTFGSNASKHWEVTDDAGTLILIGQTTAYHPSLGSGGSSSQNFGTGVIIKGLDG